MAPIPRWALSWIFVGSMHASACGYPPLSPVVSTDANTGAAAPPDGHGDNLPLHVLASSVLANAPDLSIPNNNGAITVIDTDTLSIGGQFNASFVRQGDDVILFTKALDFEGEIQLQGKAPLIISASGEVRIAARIRASAVGTTPGVGATNLGVGTPGVAVLPEGTRSSGGGGGGYGLVGGIGGAVTGSQPGGAGGKPYGGSPADPLLGGSPGGDGGLPRFEVGGKGGGGGGALQISSAVAIHIFDVISVGGGGGQGGQLGAAGGGGGGAGGEILLEAPEISVGAPLVAMGGGGGAGGAESQTGTPGLDGGDATELGPGHGGLNGAPDGSPGGTGAGAKATELVAQPGTDSATTAGGGGGGAGRIWLRYRDGHLLGAANAMPPAGLDPTLP